MLPFKKKTSERAGFAALTLTDDAVAFARVSREPDHPPVLEACELLDVDGRAGWPAVLEDLEHRHRLDRRPCNVVVQATDYSLVLVEAPEVPPEEIRDAVRWRVRDLVDFPVEDAVIDVFDVPPLKGTGRPAMTYVVAARAPEIGARTGAALDAGLDLRTVDVPELAQRNVARALPEDAAGVALLRLSRTSGVITLTRQGVLYLTRRIDIGYAGLAALAAEAVGVSDPRASGQLDALAVEVQRSLDYYESNFAQPPVGHLVVSPLPFELMGLNEYLGAQLGLSVRGLDLNQTVDVREPIELSVQDRCFEVVGGALRLAEEAR